MNFHFYTLKFCKSARYYQTQEVNPKLDRHFPRLLEQDTMSFELKKIIVYLEILKTKNVNRPSAREGGFLCYYKSSTRSFRRTGMAHYLLWRM